MDTTGPSALTRDISFVVDGMTCAACSARVERALANADGVVSAHVDLISGRAQVMGDRRVTFPAIAQAVADAGYIARDPQDDTKAARAAKIERLILFASLALAFPFIVQMIAMFLSAPAFLGMWVELVLASVVQIIAGARFYVGAARSLRHGGLGMDVLVALGTTAAYALSVWLMFVPQAHGVHDVHLYFEASATVLALVLLGKFVEARARRGAAQSLEGLIALAPRQATIIRDGAETDVAADAIVAGDIILARPGERFVADGIIVEGRSFADESLITGESVPLAKAPGDRVIAGALNGSGVLQFRATAVGRDATLSQIIKLIDALKRHKAPAEQLADRVVAIFTPAVLGLALVTLLGWLIAGSSGEASIIAAVSVLVIACPCAIGLATPAVIATATGAAARRGIVLRDAAAFAAAKTIDLVYFDKTGTLTSGTPRVVAIAALAGDEAQVLGLAAAAEKGSEHPYARAIVAEAAARGIAPVPATPVEIHPGEGIVADVGNMRIIVGAPRLLSRLHLPDDDIAAMETRLSGGGRSLALVARIIGGKPRIIGGIAFIDNVRNEARAAVAMLTLAGIRVGILSGDTPAAVQAAADAVGIGDANGHLSPAAKATRIADDTALGRHVAFVGDGLNDAAALTASRLGIAMGSGVDAAANSASIILLRCDLQLVPQAIAFARATEAKIRQNLFWAFIYNVIGLPLAALGALTPAYAGAAMAFSSVSVVLNALLLARARSFRLAPAKTRTRLSRTLRVLALVAVVAPPVAVAFAGLVTTPTLLMAIRAVEGAGALRIVVGIDAISPHLVRAVIAAEDGKFCTHWGFDLAALETAFGRLGSRGSVSGASTISMQTAKNVFLWPGRDFVRKGLEAGFTVLIETLWSKRRIMEVYLNDAEWGPGIFGAEAAALHWFGKPARDLSPTEAARLAAILPSPHKWRAQPAGPYVARRAATLLSRMETVTTQGLADCVLGD